ncbi:hypothetical protein BJ878DRAFT_572162 [Calycina marina]|uniref:Uncharacterized protein n=1 Tax=Calycina marina TaxID=1763456 RepID=A0A9P8CJ96_9HELO|nr:hypothetical protein BJ878DRAFT_572162 [Calycina marina]
MSGSRYLSIFSALYAAPSVLTSPSDVFQFTSEHLAGIPCVPIGAVCCDDGTTYVIPPSTCHEGTNPIVLKTTASVTMPSVPTITPPPTSPGPIEIEYFFTVTWYLFHYYYYYTGAATYLTSSITTSSATITVQATDYSAALGSSSSVSATLTLYTPIQTVTTVSGSPTPITYPATAYVPATAYPTTTASSMTSLSPPGYNTTVSSSPESTYVEVPVGSGGVMTAGSTWAIAALSLAFVLPTVLMLIL